MSHVVTAKIYDLAANVLADISGIALEKTVNVALNGARSFVIQTVAGQSLLTAIADDGYRVLRKGNRKLVVWEDDVIVFHGRIFTIERVGDANQVIATITAYDPRMELGYEADERAGRYVRDSTGDLIRPKFTSSVGGQTEISGPDYILQALTYSQGTGTESDPNPGEGPLPIDLQSGTFDLTVPSAVDMSGVESLMDWPLSLGDFINKFVETDAVDVDLVPVEPGTGLNLDGDPDDYIMVAASAVSKLGVDRSETVHFDYLTGSRNASACRHVEDFSTICNKLYDYLAPHKGLYRFAGNITPGSPGTTVDPTASRALYGGEFMQIRILDSLDSENKHRPLYLALWNAEMGQRVEPRDLLFITPNPDAKALFDPPTDYRDGDVVGINTGAEFGLALAETQRVYGYSKTWDRQGVARVTQLVTSADVAA